MSMGSSTESYPAFARIGLRENPGKNLNQVTCPDRDSNPGHLVSRPDALTVTPQLPVCRASEIVETSVSVTVVVVSILCTCAQHSEFQVQESGVSCAPPNNLVTIHHEEEIHLEPQDLENENTITDSPNLDEVTEAIERLKNNKAPGSDEIPAELVRKIKINRLRWVGHVAQMEPNNPVMRRDLKIMGVRNWKNKAIDRNQWEDILKQTKTRPGL
ncbi:hypothetical protein ANN_22552 [Periplaneta americana]|uniref:Uncharacterized protein n=1 Tax=Periplaneta americana TaxID=6978 RepID=A0ABQ8S8W5_PERAM|nr:hypothetical protein ANN_22552 [Periplaneta americana]